MNDRNIHMLYFSGTGTTARTVKTIGSRLACALNLPLIEDEITTPEARENIRSFSEDSIVVVGMPTYAGRLPNKIVPFLSEKVRGNRAAAIPVVLFGNRSFDNALAELCRVLTAARFRIPAAGAFVGQHAFSAKLAPGRPDGRDEREMKAFADGVLTRLRDGVFPPISVPGDADAPYYRPVGEDGKSVKILKVAPVTNAERCRGCGACVDRCAMGAVRLNENGFSETTGVCIKCCRCIQSCPAQARSFQDPEFLSHVAMLEKSHAARKSNSVFL